MWVYNSPIGAIRIFMVSSGRYALEIAGIVYGSYHSPEAAADDVYMHATGCAEWDMLSGKVPGEPTDLSEWNL